MKSEATNAILSTRDPIAALRWNALLEMQVAAYFPYELSFYLAWPEWAVQNRILDAGCGNGFFLSRLKKYFPTKTYVGIDLSAELVAAARDNGDLSDVELVHADFFTYEPTQSFDTVIMRLIVQHLAGLDQIFAKLRSLMRVGGSVIIAEPDPHLFLNYPPTPIFERLLVSYATHASRRNLNRASLSALSETLSKLDGWVVKQDKTYVAPSVGPFESTEILQIFTLWINLFRQVPGLEFPFDDAQRELEAWAKSDRTFSQVGIRILEVKRTA